MILINGNEIAISSYKDINIYLFDNVNNKSFNVIKTLKGHTSQVYDIKLMKNSQDLLVSSSNDKDVRLWSISSGSCQKIFRGHSSNYIPSIEILSDKIFVSMSTEIILWNFDTQVDSNNYVTKNIRSIKPDESGNTIYSLIMTENELIFAGDHDYIGLIKI